jgi:hypothetical protein
MRPTLYIETTIPSYLAARSTRDPLVAGQQRATKQWWRMRRSHFDVFTSQFVINEVAAGQHAMATKRLQFLHDVPRLDVTLETDNFARSILKHNLLPAKAAVDAFHIAVATVSQMHFLLTWNCTHINNREIIPHVERIATDMGYHLPVICTPLELMGTSEL